MTYRTTHENALWEYEDARGMTQRGHFVHFTDHGGTDVTYFFRRCADGALDLVSGARLKAARRIWTKCEKRGEI